MAIIRGTAGNDTLRGTAVSDTIFGFGGDDSVTAGAGNDTVYGGIGDDFIQGERGNDVLYGDAGFDGIIGGLGDDRLYGGIGDDLTLTGGQGNDRVYGGAGIDFFTDADEFGGGPSGNDFYDGGEGRDILFHEFDAPVGVTLTLGPNGAASRAVQGGEVDTVRGIESVSGTGKTDVLVGNNLGNLLEGQGGNDRLEGREGNDDLDASGSRFGDTTHLNGAQGDDRLFGGQGVDRLYAGIGADRVFVGRDLASDPRHTDFVDLGRDDQADTLNERIDVTPELPDKYGFGVDQVLNFGAEDRLDIDVAAPDRLPFEYAATTALDSDGNGRIDDADTDVRLTGGGLVLDVDASFQRTSGTALGLGDQHVVLQDVVSFDADQLI